MKSKKAQSEIITTVLIILLVLAAIVIVWMVVSNTLKGGSKAIDVGAACIGVETTIVSANSTTGEVLVQRNSQYSDYETVADVYIKGVKQDKETSALGPLEQDTVTGLTMAVGDKVKAVTFLKKDGVTVGACPTATEVTAQA